jgi:thiol:disulfide interchange protein
MADEGGPSSDDRNRRQGGPSNNAAWMKVAGLGIELAGTTLGMTAIGIGIDWTLQSPRPIATAIAALVGFAFGMFRFIQRANHSRPT